MRAPGGAPDDASVGASARFRRTEDRHRFTARRATVLRVERIAPPMVRVTVSGPDFADFASTGPADHVRVYFPDAGTGALIAPTAVSSGDDGVEGDGIVRPDGIPTARDLTPLPRTAAGGVDIDLDFFTHPDPGPASAWAERARPGDELVVVGPRVSLRAPQDAARLLLMCDETSLPAASRWIRDVPPGTVADVVVAVPGAGTWVAPYLGDAPGVDVRVHIVPDGSRWPAAMADLAPVDGATFVWAAGESSALVPLRRHLRRVLGLPAAQTVVSGYWRRGAVAGD